MKTEKSLFLEKQQERWGRKLMCKEAGERGEGRITQRPEVRLHGAPEPDPHGALNTGIRAESEANCGRASGDPISQRPGRGFLGIFQLLDSWNKSSRSIPSQMGSGGIDREQ